MRGYGRDFQDQQRYLSGGSESYRDRMRHNPSWENESYGGRRYGSGMQGGGYGGGRDMGGNDWRSRSYMTGGSGRSGSAGNGRGFGRDHDDYGQGDFPRRQPMSSRGGGMGYDRGMMSRPVQPYGRGHSGAGGYGMSRGTGPTDAGMGMGGDSGGPFGNPTSRGDYFLGYGGSSRRGYSPFW